MKNLTKFILLILIFTSCEKEDSKQNVIPDNYGKGMYVVSDLGISYYDYKVGNDSIISNIFQSVNASSVINPKSIKFYDDNAYIIGDRLYIVDINSFESIREITGFSNPDYCERVSFDRLLVTDRGSSMIRVVDLNTLNITSSIETGDSTKPVFIISNSNSAYILNGGGVPASYKDSTMLVIQHKDQLVATNNILASIDIGDNPISGMIRGDLLVLCKGVYNIDNNINNTESSFYKIYPNKLEVFFSEELTNIYNADNLLYNYYNGRYYFTAEGGIYGMSSNATSISLLTNVNADILVRNEEMYSDTDTTQAWANMLYMNDINNPGSIYKYNMSLAEFVDTLIFNGSIRDIKFYN
tara:strand:- start:5842 stop:6906 length:1065 start_codon:yes stop_codon:yes gene_type:complete